MWHLPSPQIFQLKNTRLSQWEPLKCVFVCCGPSLCLSASLHLSHDFTDSGSPGVSHLGHQLHSQVNCSSKWSAKQCRKKKRVIGMIHRRAHITGAWQDQSRTPAINKPMRGVRDLLEHSEMDDGNMLKRKGTLSDRKASSMPLWILQRLPSAVGETVLPGQINWRAFAHRPLRLMKRPRGYLQGHTKELL